MDTIWIWIASWMSAIVLLGLMVKRKLHREYPIFFAFLLAETVADLTNFCLSFGSMKAYFYAYWVGALITTCLGFAVLHEIFRLIFRPYESLRSFGSTLFKWSSVVLLMIGAIMAITSSPSTEYPIANLILTVDRSVRLMQCGLVLFMYLFSRHLGLTERHRVFGISIGFGLTAGLHLTAVTLQSLAPKSGAVQFVNTLHQVAYLASVIVWAVYMYRPEPDRRRASVLEQPETWNYALQAATNGNGGSPFLPSVVDTVEKVLTKRATNITSEFRLR
jgi:hypothetical protein